jgi:predicted amidophosphoribosyltransferase
MTRVQRFENLKNCFAVPHPELVKDRTVIVFDDILTTGATFKDARRALEQAGANKIICVAIAH